jgi:hypothetical protein
MRPPGLRVVGSSGCEGTTTTQSSKEDTLNTTRTPVTVTVTILPNTTNTPPGKLADAELHFADGCGHREVDLREIMPALSAFRRARGVV